VTTSPYPVLWKKMELHPWKLRLNPEIEKGLLARAQARGVTLNDYLQEIVDRDSPIFC
jgi:hypothetical protein